MLTVKHIKCIKCGESFKVKEGGVNPKPVVPICNKCMLKKLKSLFD